VDDFLDEIIVESEKKTPGFREMVERAQVRRRKARELRALTGAEDISDDVVAQVHPESAEPIGERDEGQEE
jgi:hypothetical protein